MRCFSSPGSPPAPMNSAQDTPKGVGFPIRKSPDQSLLATPRGLSQRATSFIASRCQGIHQMPFSRLRATSIRRDKPKTHERSREKTLPEPPTDLPPPPTRRSRAPSEAKYLFTMPKNENDRRRQTPPAKTCFHEYPDPANPTGPFHVPGVGGGERVRTDDLLLAKQVLSQLSYAPIRGQKSMVKAQRSRQSSSDF